ncbi:MAG: hypothetical protein FJ290_23985 [Planctomycetes bacterium]|nr:hypothetical protein [Planctomycetota bacterium]
MGTRQRLLDVLHRVGKPAELLDAADGAALLILPYGGRVLGLFAPGSDENFLWTHPALESAPAAEAFFASDEWHNSGGDRTWLAPEADFFLPRFPDTTLYHQPRQLDPGAYTCERRGSAIRLENRLTLRSSRAGQDVELRITRCVEPAANPLRHNRRQAAKNHPQIAQMNRGKSGFGLCEICGPILDSVSFAGYTLRSSLEILGGSAANGVGLWSLLQLPHGGEMLIPTWSRAEPRVYFGQIPPDALRIEERLIRYAMCAEGEQKIGVRALAATGRAGYLRDEGRACTLVVRNFAVNPSGAYVDVPWDDPADLGYAVQACSVVSRLGRFSELEYHVPAIGGQTGLTRCDDASQVWAFRGEPEHLVALSRLLLGAWPS